MDLIGAELACDELPEGTRLVRLAGKEGMNELSRWEAGVVSATVLDAEALVGAPVAIRLADDKEGVTRVVGLVAEEVAHEGSGRDGEHYTLCLAPDLLTLTLRSGYRVFQNKTVREIVEQVLSDAGIAADRLVFRLAGTYVPRPYCVQYGETEWEFVERLLADEGISYWTDTDENETPIIVFGDATSSYDSLPTSNKVPFQDGSAAIPYRRFSRLSRSSTMVTQKTHLREFDVRAPDALIEGDAGAGDLEHFEYPACVLTASAAKERAKVRLEQLQRRKDILAGRSDCIRLRPGRIVTIEGAADDWHQGDFVVVAMSHHYELATPGQGAAASYSNEVEMVAKSEVPERPPVPASPPKVDGFEPAITTGPAGQEIHVDDLGRVKVRFPWDRAGLMDDASSYWVRTLQMNMSGSMILPRVGWEVPVAYIDGNPDKPFVLGRVYNGNSIVPYGLPGASATTTLQSATSPGGGSTTEIRMGDGAGGQEMFIHAAKDQTVVVGGSATTDVSANLTHDVTLTLRATVTASQTTVVSGSQSVNVGTNYGISTGARSETIGGMEHIKVTANRRVGSGPYTEMIGALYGVQCNQSNTSVKGAFTQLIGGSLSVNGGLGVSETVVAARTELVGGTKSLTVARGVSEKVLGARAISAGACTEKAGGKVSTGVKAAGKISVGGTATLKAGGGFAIEAPSITIQAASLSAKALALAGGALQAKEGKTHVNAATIKRQAGGELG